jgi:DNA-binding XRE family transcriptional regulator
MRKNEKTDSPRPVFKIKRKEMGSQRIVGLKLGLTEIHVRQLENGYCNPSMTIAFKCGAFFKTSVYELFPDLADPNNWPELK